MNPRMKFGAITFVVLAVLVWLAATGIDETATYYVTIEEMHDMDNVHQRRIRVGGDVEPGSIVRKDGRVEFTITQEERTLNVVYTGRDPLPDTFRDRAQALCDGKLRSDNVFEAQKIQAKCTSKYETNPGEGQTPIHESDPANKAAF